MKRLREYLGENLDALLGVFEVVVKGLLFVILIVVFCFLYLDQKYILAAVELFVVNVFLLSFHDKSRPVERLMTGIFMVVFGGGMMLFSFSAAINSPQQISELIVVVIIGSGCLFGSTGFLLVLFAYRAISNMEERMKYWDLGDPIEFLTQHPWTEPE